jgi:hypothetical protein
MARVCARRAASIIIGEYLSRLGYSNLGTSIYKLFSIFKSISGISEQYKDVVSHFILPVNPDHKLPDQIDLLSEAQWLADHLLLKGNG